MMVASLVLAMKMVLVLAMAMAMKMVLVLAIAMAMAMAVVVVVAMDMDMEMVLFLAMAMALTMEMAMAMALTMAMAMAMTMEMANMKIKYLVTNRAEAVSALQDKGYQIVMIDGTVPNWEPRWCDLHYDHHRQGGEPVQLHEMPCPLPLGDKVCFVTTQVDADACVAAVYGQIDPIRDTWFTGEIYQKLSAIAFDCDHLGVPDRLSAYADFASNCVATMKQEGFKLVESLGLNPDRKLWTTQDKELYASTAFEKGTKDLLEACADLRKFPGEKGEAEKYWKQVERDTKQVFKRQVSIYLNCAIFNAVPFVGRYIDPRVWIKALKQRYEIDDLYPITLTCRERVTEDGVKGYSYTLGSIPLHPKLDSLDYTKGAFEALTKAEKEIDPDSEGWGGRKTVGGSGWNTPSNLSFEDVIDIVLQYYDWQH